MLAFLLLPVLVYSQKTSIPPDPFHCRHFIHGYYKNGTVLNGEMPWGIMCPQNTTTCITAHLKLEGYPDWYVGACGATTYGCTEAEEIEPRNITASQMRKWIYPMLFSVYVEQFSVVKANCCTGTRCNAPLDGLECDAWNCHF